LLPDNYTCHTQWCVKFREKIWNLEVTSTNCWNVLSAKGKDVQHKFCCNLLLTITRESAGSNNPYEATEHTRERERAKLNMFCALSKHKLFGPPPSLNIPELTQYTSKHWRNSSCLFWKKRLLMTYCANRMEHRIFSAGCDGLLIQHVSRKMDKHGQAYHKGTYFTWPSPLGGESRLLCMCHHWQILCRNLLGG
jgi:hypothetical protein